MTNIAPFLSISSLLVIFITQIWMTAGATILQNAIEPCSCNGTITPRVDNMCICGGCEQIKIAYMLYTPQCPPEKTTNLDKIFAKKCHGIENTEDCEYFKQLPGKVTDDYKRCKDELDSIRDDCENCVGCSLPSSD